MLQNGAADYILKPFKLERMRQALENYKQYKRKIEEHDTMSQEQLDMLLKIPQNPSRDLPKGLNHFTMNEILTYMKQQTEPLSAEEAAKALGIARVTARRYLDFLEKDGQIKLDIQYGEWAGRLTATNSSASRDQKDQNVRYDHKLPSLFENAIIFV